MSHEKVRNLTEIVMATFRGLGDIPMLNARDLPYPAHVKFRTMAYES